MKNYISILIAIFFITHLMFSQTISENKTSDFTIAFGSCNKQNSPQPFWEEILKSNPDLFIWGGDNIYGDSDDMSKIANDYKTQNDNPGYQKLKSTVPVLATWDDHDYGKNDAGVAWKMKKESQQLFHDFLDVPKNDPRRMQEGVYSSKVFKNTKGSIKVIVLDTRYFRSALLKDITGKKRYVPYKKDEGTVLGDIQWQWLEEELMSSTSDFNIIVTSIQFLSSEHGWECWANFPGEVTRLEQLIKTKNVKNAIILSGDRHISEFSITKIKGLAYPLIDFTSSGLTHAYTKYVGEPNKTRVGEVVFVPSFGVLKFDFNTKEVTMQMRGDNNVLLQEIKQQYPEN